MPDRSRLSAVLIAKDEERRIARCLESVAGWADEIVVVDGMSTDRTVEICERYGAKVIRRPFSGDFGQERNAGNEAATGDWILQLDADDAVSPQLREQIEQVLSNGSPYTAYKFRRKNWFLGHEMRYGGWYHYYPHLFRRGQARFEGRVHHLLKTQGPMGVLEGALEHRPFDSIEQFIARHNRYTTIEAQEMWDRQGLIDLRVVRYQLTRRPLKLFWKMYVRKQGFREGWHGLVFSILFAWVHVMKWAKYWEVARATSGGLDSAAVPPPSAEGPLSVQLSSLTQFIERQNHHTSVESRRLFERQGRVPGRMLAYQLTWRPMKLFWKSYRKNQGWREGEHGLVFGLLYAFAHVMFWANYWSMCYTTQTTHGPR